MLRTRIPAALLLAVLVAIVLEPLVANAASARVLSSLLSKDRRLRGSAEPKPEPWMGDAIPNVEVPTMRELPAVFNVSDDHPTNTPAPIPVAAIPSFVPHVKCIHTDEGCELNLYLTTKINVPAKMPPSPLILAYDQAPKFRHKFWRAPRVPVVLPMKVSVIPLEDPLQFEGLSDLEAQALADFRAGAAKAALRLGRADLAHDNKVLRRVGNADARHAAAKAAARAAVALSKAKNSMKISNKMLKAVVRAAGKIRPLAEYAAVSSQLNAAGLHVLRPGNKGDNSYEGLKVFAKTTARR